MAFGETIRAGSAILKRNFSKILVIGCLSYFFTFALLFGAGRVILLLNDIPDPTEYWLSLSVAGKLCWLLGFVLAEWLPQLMTHAGAARIALREKNGDPASFPDAMKIVIVKLPSLTLLALLIGVPALIGSLVLVIPGLIVSAIGVMIVPEMILRELPLGQAIREGLRVGWKHLATVGLLLGVVVGAALALSLVVTSVVAVESRMSFVVFMAALALLGALAASVIGATVSAVCIEHHRPSLEAGARTS